MQSIHTVIIGGGQAGLAMSRCLAERGIEHVVLERGRIGERWRTQRWDSLRLLTPRWMTRLPGHRYSGTDADGFMGKNEVVDFLTGYARFIDAPVQTGVTVLSVACRDGRYRVLTTRGDWTARNVVLATGYCDKASIPAMARGTSPEITHVAPNRYRNPAQLPEGGVLVVGASATGIQLASEIARSGRKVILSTGRHIRLPRNYRDRDILFWMDRAGVLSQRFDRVPDLGASRRQPSLQLVGTHPARSLDLNTVQDEGVRVVGRLRELEGCRAGFATDLVETVEHAEAKLQRQLDLIDRHIVVNGMQYAFPHGQRPDPIRVPLCPGGLNLRREGIQTILWATGYRRDYSWLQVPVLNASGELIHRGGITPAPGLYAMGLNFMRRRNSSFIDGVGRDAAELADHLAARSRDLLPQAC